MHKKSCLVAIASIAVALPSLASAQTASMWLNQAGDAPSTVTTSISVAPNSVINLSGYLQSSSASAILVTALVGYTTASSMGTGATPDASFLSFGSATWVAPFASGALPTVQAGGTGSGTRPYGASLSSGLVTGTFGVATDTPVKAFDISLNIGNAALGSTHEIVLWDGQSVDFSSSVTYDNFNSAFPGTQRISVNVVPEPTTMLGFAGVGLLALRRRRSA